MLIQLEATATIDAYDFDGASAVGAVTLTEWCCNDSSVVTGVVKFSSVKVFTHSHQQHEYFDGTTVQLQLSITLPL